MPVNNKYLKSLSIDRASFAKFIFHSFARVAGSFFSSLTGALAVPKRKFMAKILQTGSGGFQRCSQIENYDCCIELISRERDGKGRIKLLRYNSN